MVVGSDACKKTVGIVKTSNDFTFFPRSFIGLHFTFFKL